MSFVILKYIIPTGSPKNAEYMNASIKNYLEMQNIFDSSVATDRFAMGSNEALGEPQDQDTIDVNYETPKRPMDTQIGTAVEDKGEATSSGRRRRRRRRRSRRRRRRNLYEEVKMKLNCMMV